MMQSVRVKEKPHQKKKKIPIEVNKTTPITQSVNDRELVDPVTEVENSLKDFTFLQNETDVDDFGQLPSAYSLECDQSTYNVESTQSEKTLTLNQRQHEVEVAESKSSVQNFTQVDKDGFGELIHRRDEILKQKTDVCVGYDVISDYMSSSEEAIVLNAYVDDCADINDKSESKSASAPVTEENIFAEFEAVEELSSPPNPIQDYNCGYMSSVTNMCYPDILSQIANNMTKKESHENLKPFTELEMSNLYFNDELRSHDQFVNNFIEVELRSGSVVNHVLYQLLTDYLTCRDNLCKNEMYFKSLLEDCKQYRKQIWNCDTSTLTEYGECQDGNPVSATHKYIVAHFNSYFYEKFSHCVNNLEDLATKSYISNIFNKTLYYLKIQHYIDSICSSFSFLSPQVPIQLYNESKPRGPYGIDLRPVIIELKSAISVLFSFQRRLSTDEQFIAETRQWLMKLVSVLLRLATPNDHLFLLHHILRCPAGVGKWASHLIQPPVSCQEPLNQFYLDHLITTLAAILLPIESRDVFLQRMDVGQEDNSVWVIIDSDGEDDENNSISRTALKENDLISFLNQIPLADLFRQIILVSRRNEEDIYDVNMITDHDLLRSIAICTLLVNLFEKGIAQYSNPTYKQFCKLLSRLIQHTACYMTEHWQMFREAYIQRSIVDSEMLARLQLEYDEFFLRVVNTLYTTRDRIGWQYLATLPFGMITTHTLWRLYQYLFYVNSESGLLMSEVFMETLVQLPDNDIYYFLTTVTNMAMCRKYSDSLFIQSVALQIFKIGFVNSVVRDKCMKPSRILIANLTNKHPNLISDILLALKKDFVLVGKFALYLFKELPISLWKPNSMDTQTIRDWLLGSSLTSWENNLARFILSQLNWSTDMTETDLFLSRDFHCHIAVIIVKAVYIYAEEELSVGSAAIISQGMRQVSSIVRSQTPEQALNNWAWQMLSKLKLHLLDQPVRVARMSLTDNRMIAQIPFIDGDTEDMCVLSDGISRNHSVAFYVALLTSNVGHSLPVICENCWDYCEPLLLTYRYSQVLHILQLTLPYFLSSTDLLVKQEKFLKVISKLVVADYTYMKMAKNLIVTDFPGTILKQFASLIQYHIDNFSRYCLSGPHKIIEMWLRILCSVWNDSCRSVAYLMDKIFCMAYRDDSLKKMIVEVLSELTQTVTLTNRSRTSGGLTSLVSWIGYGSSADFVSVPISLLPRNSTVVIESPYFSYFALYLEEKFTQCETQLWAEVLKYLAATSGKPNIDLAIKKACALLKLNSMPSSWLAIYRWSQYALELPCDHPILPLYWQNFFRLYLYRVPGNNSTVCVGKKFFEGTINSNYLKNIKKKLQECVTHFTNKTFADEFEVPFYNSLIALYKSFILWLEEPWLHEPDLFLPALSGAFNATKLSEVMKDHETVWTEYVHFDRIEIEQKPLIDEWNKALHRDTRNVCNRIICFPEDINTVANMIDRLKSYDKKLEPPELIVVASIVPVIRRDKFLIKSQLLYVLEEHWQVLAQFTKSYAKEKNEQHNAAKSMLDVYKSLYSDIEVDIKLYAACDTASPIYKQKNAASIHCAGPALITFHIWEGRLNKAMEHAAEKNEIDFQGLLKQNLKRPSMQLVTACIVIESTIETLSKEVIEVREAGDLTMLNKLHNVGTAVFYKLVSVYNSHVSLYFPIKMLIRRMIDTLGLACIDNIESECPILLRTILNNTKISTILVPHLTPSVVSATSFVRLYNTVTRVILPNNVDFVLSVITKFSVKNWLREKSPKLIDRSQLIEVIANSLKEIGPQPSEPLLPLDKILRKDMCEILMYDFPEHYGEILHVVLKCSAEEKFSCDMWYDVLNTLLLCTSKKESGKTDINVLRPGLSITQIRDVALKYAFELTNLSLQELIETCNMLGGNFIKERLQYGLYGLYPKYKIYIEPIIALHSMVGHAMVASVLYVHRTVLADQICETIWPVLLNLYSPWVCPYFTGNMQEQPEAWIQQLTDDRSILLPWTHLECDMSLANKMMATFTECIKFIMDTLPACQMILNNVLQWYTTQFAHGAVKEHVLSVVQNNLIVLKWSRYVPTISDMELMSKVVDQYLPMCHSFLGSVFVDISWETVIKNDHSQSATRTHIIFLNLLIKLANEPNLRQSGKVTSLLQTAQQFHWHLVDATNYEHVLNWFVMSYDSRVLLLITDEDCNGIDMAAFELLRIAAGYVEANIKQHPTTSRKRQMFVKACVKLCLQLANRYKAVFANHQHQMELALTRMVDQMESIITATVTPENRVLECALLLHELLVLLNQPRGSMLPKIVIQVLSNWLSHKSATSCVLQGLLNIIRASVTDTVHLGIILETCLTVWFKNSGGMKEHDWSEVLDIIHADGRVLSLTEETFVTSNHVLTLYALTAKQFESEVDLFSYSKLIQWISIIKPSVDNESKLPILWSLAFKNRNIERTEITTSLLKLCTHFQQITCMKQGWGLFSIIGMHKQHVPTLRCKLLAHILNAFIMVKVNEVNDEKMNLKQSETPESEKRDAVVVNAECMKSVSTLESLISDKFYSEYKVTVETALKLIKSKNVTIGQGEQFIITLAKQLYIEGYIHAFRIESL